MLIFQFPARRRLRSRARIYHMWLENLSYSHIGNCKMLLERRLSALLLTTTQCHGDNKLWMDDWSNGKNMLGFFKIETCIVSCDVCDV